MAYTKTNWQDLPDTTTPINATNLNHIENGIKDNDDKLLGNAKAGDFKPESISWRETGYGDKFQIIPDFGGADDQNMLKIKGAVGGAGTDPSLYDLMTISGKNGNVNIKGNLTSSSFFSKTWDFNTENTTDTWVPVSGSNGKWQHRVIPITTSGSNANGYYTKFGDGTLICRGTVGPVTTNAGTGATKSVTLPTSFIDTNWTGTLTKSAGGANWAMVDEILGNITTTSFVISTWNNATSQAPNIYYNWIAIGRWK